MRLAGASKGGFFPLHPDAVSRLLESIKPPPEGECYLLDPCAGNGAALLQLAEGLNAIPYGVELADDRSDVIAEKIPPEQFLASTDFLRTRINHDSFSCVFTNPPFDYSATGGHSNRVERVFIDAALPLLVDGGLLIMICPEDVADDYRTTSWFAENCYDVSVIRFPEEVRPYREVAVCGLKRKKRQASGWLDFDELADRQITYQLPPGKKPTTFIKSEPTDEEVEVLLQKSTLKNFLNPVGVQRKLPRPPLAINEGHIALLLASGFVNGVVLPPGEEPHVVRGYVSKDQYLKSSDCDEDANGTITTKSVYSERINLVIRTLDHLGNITTLSTAKDLKEELEDEAVIDIDGTMVPEK